LSTETTRTDRVVRSSDLNILDVYVSFAFVILRLSAGKHSEITLRGYEIVVFMVYTFITDFTNEIRALSSVHFPSQKRILKKTKCNNNNHIRISHFGKKLREKAQIIFSPLRI